MMGRAGRICRRMTRKHAKTFYFASHCLGRETRSHAFAVYGFCRWCDDGVDHARSPAEAHDRVAIARDALDRAYGDGPVGAGLMAFRHTIRERSIPKDLFGDLLDGMTMDLTQSRYHDFAALDLYCYRVAGVVGLIMTHVFGFRDPQCLPFAKDLGTAMQLTNILRDVAEDRDRGRIYLPLEEMRRFDLSEADLDRGTVDDRFRGFMKFQIDRARSYYRSAEQGIPDLVGTSSRLTVRLMGNLYGGILDAIERLDYNVFEHRAHVPLRRKMLTLAACQGATFGEGLSRFWG